MKLYVEADAVGLARRAADLVSMAIRSKPDLVLALPAGRTPLGMYAELVRLHQTEELDFSQVCVFSLDEYLGVGSSDPNSFHHYLWSRFLSHLNVRPGNVRLASASADDAFCERYEHDIRQAGGIDLAVAGVGSNGHVAFNEPGSAFDSRTRIVDLAESTLHNINAVFGSSPPRRAVTMGIATILEARAVLLLAAGKNKRGPLTGLLHGPITMDNPASALRMHPELTVVADEEATKT